MKDSVVKTVPLGDVVDVIGGGTPSKRNPAFYRGEIPWATVRDMNVEHLLETEHSITPAGLKGSSSKIIPAGEVVIATRVGLGKVCILGQDTAINQDLRGLVPKSDAEIDRRFLFHWYKSIADKVIEAGTGATVQGVKLPFVKSLPFPTLTLEEQQRIVAVLDEAFEGLARARAHAEANLQNARELFIQELAQIFSSGKEGWIKGTIEELCKIRSGTTVPKSQERPSGDLPYVKVADMNLIENTGGIQTSSRFLEKLSVSDRNIIPAGSTIFPKRGGAIMTNKKRKVLKDICADLNVMAVIPGRKVDEDFLHFFFQSLDMRQIGSGSAIPQINNYDIYPLSLSYPSDLQEQAEVAETLQVLRNQTIDLIKSYEVKLQDLDDLRQSILQKAFAGELT